MSPHHSRRRLLQYLAASPLFAHRALAEGLVLADPMQRAPRDLDKLIRIPTGARRVRLRTGHEEERGAGAFRLHGDRRRGRMTLRANREGFRKFELRPRRLVDVSKVDMSVEIFGVKYDSPIVIAPTGSNKAFHADGEIAVSKAAKQGNHLQILSSVATTSIEDAIAARGAPVLVSALYDAAPRGRRSPGPRAPRRRGRPSS